MAENDYLKLLGNKIFWGAIIGSIIISGTGAGFYYGLKEDIQAIDTKLEIQSIKIDNSVESIKKDVSGLQDQITEIKLKSVR